MPPNDSSGSGSASIAPVEALLQKTIRISISDRRIFIGTFVCMDKQRNLIVTNTEEFHLGGSHQGRYVGMVMVPWNLVLKVEVETSDETGTDDDDFKLYI